jgi:hypothetical protein
MAVLEIEAQELGRPRFRSVSLSVWAEPVEKLETIAFELGSSKETCHDVSFARYTPSTLTFCAWIAMNFRRITAELFVFAIASLGCASAQTKRALVIGINNYQPQGVHAASCTYGRCELGSFDNLDGAVNDARSIADILTGPKFGFPADKVVLLTNPAPVRTRPGIVVLPAEQTTRDGILSAMKRYLVDVPQRGDTVVFYYAGHGSLRVNTKGTKLRVLLDNGGFVHADSTLVPSDSYKGGYDVTNNELTLIFNAALEKGVHLTVIMDSSHTGMTSYEVLRPSHSLAFDPRDIDQAPLQLPDGHSFPEPTARRDNPLLFFSGTSQEEEGNEADVSPESPEPLGVFTKALIEALQELPADAPASLISRHVKAIIEDSGAPDQHPELDAPDFRVRQPLFGGTEDNSSKTVVAVVRSDEKGVLLDAGSTSGLGVGSELVSVATNRNGQKLTLRIKELVGEARSSADILTPKSARITPGELFELVTLVPANPDELALWVSTPALSSAQLQAAVTELRASGVNLVSDPVEQQWNYILDWDGKNWILHRWQNSNSQKSEGSGAANIGAIVLGPTLSRTALQTKLPVDAVLWPNMPPSKELATRLSATGLVDSIRKANSIHEADYVLAGAVSKKGPMYTWIHREEFLNGPPVTISKNHSPGCSETSPYPVRTEWVDAPDGENVANVSDSLSQTAARLAKVHGWLELSNSPAHASSNNYYRLQFVGLNVSDRATHL